MSPRSHLGAAREQRLLEMLTTLYDPGTAQGLAATLLHRARGLPPRGSPEPVAPDEIMLITYANSIVEPEVPPLETLRRFLLRHLGMGFSSIHVLPFFPSSSDDGFAVIDFRQVDPDLGDWDDVDALAEEFHLMVDLVINHCSRESLWFADFVSDREPGRNFFITVGPVADVSRVTRPRNSPLITNVHTYRGVKQVWTTFSEDQVDLNFANPEVLIEMVDIFFRYVEHGARYIRLDAIAYLWKTLGTTCLHLRETHLVVKILRLLLEASGQPVRLVTETNVPHEENVSYFGSGDEAHIVYQFSLAPLLLYSYVFEDASYLRTWAQSLEPPPDGASYLNFIASHDGIGLRPLEGLMPEERVQALVDRMHERGGFVTLREAEGGIEVPYEINISLFSALGGSLNDLPAYLAAHALLLAFQGVPAIYIHSLLASENDLKGVEQTGRTRSINRGRWTLDTLEARLGDPHCPQYHVMAAFRNMLGRRGAIAAFSPDCPQRILDMPASAFALERRSADQRVTVVASVSAAAQTIDPGRLELLPGRYTDLLTGNPVEVDPLLQLKPFQVLWLDVPR
jgi:sucrose phosphorylase